MLTGKLVRVRYGRGRVIPAYLDAADLAWQEAAEGLLCLFRGQEGRTRGELDEDVRETFGSLPQPLIYQGLAKLIEDRCEFEVVSDHPPEQLRERVFAAATRLRNEEEGRSKDEPDPFILPPSESSILHPSAFRLPKSFDRDAVLRQTALELGLTPEEVDRGLFADLKSEQRLVRFKDLTAERLLQRYNVALAQAVLLRSTGVQVFIRGESPQRYRQLMRQVKFHRLICEVERTGPDSCRLNLDGPLSLFTATQKYGLQLAQFLPSILHCADFELTADLRWGPERKPRQFILGSQDQLVSHLPDTGMYLPPELAMFAELFRKKIDDWEITAETDVFPLGGGFWVPDYRLVQRGSGRTVYLEVLGFWRRSSALKHLERLRRHARQSFLLAVSDQLHIDDAELEDLPAGIHRFRQMPLPDEIARLAQALPLQAEPAPGPPG